MCATPSPDPIRPSSSGGGGELSSLPGIDVLLERSSELVARYGRAATKAALREVVGDVRNALRGGLAESAPPTQTLVAAAAETLGRRRPGPPRRVLNAAGVVVHTNLGRAPLSAAAQAAVADAAGYCDLEFDLDSGGRGARGAGLEALLAEAALLGGAVPGMPDVAGIAVNNAAAALVLALTALAQDRQVPVSRGELVEIGGSFRLPEIMAASGARLIEVGTTNRTRAGDYRAGEDVGMLLKVHPSNYRVTGFTAEPSVGELAAVARQRGVPLLHDIGSGLLTAPDPRRSPWAIGEPTLSGSLRAGADLVICSGDKLLGGPQAGLLVGRPALVDRCRRHPLARAVRLDKLRVAALVATLEAHLAADGAPDLPVWRMLQADVGLLAARCKVLATAVGGGAEVTEALTVVGGGAAPQQGVSGPVVRLPHAHPGVLAAALRAGDPPVVARVEREALWLDLRTVEPDDDVTLVRSIREALGAA